MDICKDKVSNSIQFSQCPWQYSRGPFNIPVKPDKIQLYTMDGFAMEQMLCRLYLLFPKIEKHEICRLFKMYNADTWRTIDTLLYSEMTRITNINKYLRLKRMPPPKKPRGQCARTYVTRPLRKSYNWRNIISGTVYNVQPKDSPVPQVKRVLNHYSGYLCAERFRNLVPNVTFDSNGINSIVFETLQPEGGGAGGGKADVENKSTCLPRKHEMESVILDNPGPVKMVLHSQLLDSSGTNESRDSIKMKLYRDGDGYCAKLIPA